jgi:dolichol-phosphate mannosyltransferase
MHTISPGPFRNCATCAVVIPAYNVDGFIGAVISQLPGWIDHIIVVDDCSTDNTFEVASATHHPKLRLIRHERNGGVGAAMKTGYREALRLHADIIVKMDGDDQMDPSQLPALVAPLLRAQADYAKGNRFRDRDTLRVMPILRRIGNLALSFLTKLASGYWNIFDPTNGYTAIRRETLTALPLDRLGERYFFEISMLVQLNLTNACVRDVPMPSRYGVENSSLRIGRVVLSFPPKLVASTLSRLWTKYFIYDFTAVSLFIVAGVPLMLTGAALGIKYWSHSIATGVPTTPGQVMLSVFPLLLGFQLLLQAFVIDINAVPQGSAHGPLEFPDLPSPGSGPEFGATVVERAPAERLVT